MQNVLKASFLTIAWLWSLSAHTVLAQATTAFSYQGELLANGTPTTGAFDFRFRLFAAAVSGAPLAAAEQFLDRTVTDGIFRVELDFGDVILSDEEFWLEIGVRAHGQPEFDMLAPRQRIKPAPRTLLATAAAPGAVASAGIVDNSLTGNDIAPGAVIPGKVASAAVGAGAVQAGAVTADRFQIGAVESGHLAGGAIGASQLAANSVGAGELATDSVGGADIALGAVGSDALIADSVTTGKIAADAVGTSQIAFGAVGAGHVQPGGVKAVDTQDASVQRRINACSAESSIRAVQSTGAVICETDNQGVTDLTNPVTFTASVFNGGGSATTQMSPVSTHLCMLSQVDTRDDDGFFEQAICRVRSSGGIWELEAFALDNDEDALCAAICLKIVTF